MGDTFAQKKISFYYAMSIIFFFVICSDTDTNLFHWYGSSSQVFLLHHHSACKQCLQVSCKGLLSVHILCLNGLCGWQLWEDVMWRSFFFAAGTHMLGLFFQRVTYKKAETCTVHFSRYHDLNRTKYGYRFHLSHQLYDIPK